MFYSIVFKYIVAYDPHNPVRQRATTKPRLSGWVPCPGARGRQEAEAGLEPRSSECQPRELAANAGSHALPSPNSFFCLTPSRLPRLGLLSGTWALSVTSSQVLSAVRGSWRSRDGASGGLTAPLLYPGPVLHPPFSSPWSLSPHLCSELRLLLFSRHQALQFRFIRLTQVRHSPRWTPDLPSNAYAHAQRARARTPDFRFTLCFPFRCFRSPLWGGSCRITASGLLDDLEPSGARWRFSGGWVSSAVPKEAEVRNLSGWRFLAKPPAGEGHALRIRLQGGETSWAGNPSSFPLAALAPAETTAVTTLASWPRCSPERVSPLL